MKETKKSDYKPKPVPEWRPTCGARERPDHLWKRIMKAYYNGPRENAEVYAVKFSDPLGHP